ncbi:PrsW family intramembrane metalloprotease [Streptomyces sp. bgisy022]|uniref:PrsW family intramembrane metalloprotease n=1 Tax=Streptomyces sp. bgisy022 TaxID=3413769 RepID=UPI003D7659D1
MATSPPPPFPAAAGNAAPAAGNAPAGGNTAPASGSAAPVAVPPGTTRRHPPWWQRPWARYGGPAALLAVAGLVILALVRDQTGTEGFLVGLGLAVLPVPLLVAAFRWLQRVAPGPLTHLVFAFAWGACAAALMSIVANSFATRWIASATADPSRADTLGATVIAPVVEETAKAAAVALVLLFRRHDVGGILHAVVIAGLSATGFAFTENILYFGNAFGTDRLTGDSGLTSLTAATFFVRAVMSPFAHPLFTVLTGIGFGLAALAGERRRVRRALLPLSGLLLAMGLHALWNASPNFGEYGFLAVYAAFMVPLFGLLTWLVVWTRQRELRIVRTELPAYAAAGWLAPAEPFALGSMRARRLARQYARRHGGRAAAREVARYAAEATALASLRHRGASGRAPADFAVRESELLGAVWRRREWARPALEHAARITAPPLRVTAPPPGALHGYGYGYGYGPAAGYGPDHGGHPGPGGPGPHHGWGHGHGYDLGHGWGYAYGAGSGSAPAPRPAERPHPAYASGWARPYGHPTDA